MPWGVLCVKNGEHSVQIMASDDKFRWDADAVLST